MAAKVQPEGGENDVQANSKEDVKLLISCAVTAVVFLALGFIIPEPEKSAAQKAAEAASGRALDPITMVKNFFIAGGTGMAVHSAFMPFFMMKKKKDIEAMNSKPLEETTFTADGKTKIYARKMSICQKLIALLVGSLISLVNMILSIMAYVGLDLKILFFPLPFYEFWKSKMVVSQMRIKGAKLRLKATFSDAYFLWLKISRNNLYTCGCYGKRCNKLGYEKWLDKRLAWAGTIPEGFNNDFVIFAVRASLCERIQLAVLKLIFGAVLSACAPLTQPYLMYKLYKFELAHMVIGGKTPFFKEDFTYQNMLKTYFVSCCGCRKAVIWKFVDSNIDFDWSAQPAPAQQEMDREV